MIKKINELMDHIASRDFIVCTRDTSAKRPMSTLYDPIRRWAVLVPQPFLSDSFTLFAMEEFDYRLDLPRETRLRESYRAEILSDFFTP
jgi:hypothetical protein